MGDNFNTPKDLFITTIRHLYREMSDEKKFM